MEQAMAAEREERGWRKAYYVRLREEVKKQADNPLAATVLCMMIAHTRGKLHCRSWQKYHGGWRTTWHDRRQPRIWELVEEMRQNGRFEKEDFLYYEKRLGSGCERKWAEYLFASSVIDTLDDQADFLRRFLRREAKRAETQQQVLKKGRREPYSWEKPALDEEIHDICKHIVGTSQ